jgi:NADPH:quinone reductase-like Zn-dependent oxidoreductase
MIERAVTAADLGIRAHARMLRYAYGYKLANDGHTPEQSRLISVIARFRIRRAISRWRRSELRVIIDKTYPFATISDGLAYLESGRAKGKVVVTMK